MIFIHPCPPAKKSLAEKRQELARRRQIIADAAVLAVRAFQAQLLALDEEERDILHLERIALEEAQLTRAFNSQPTLPQSPANPATSN
jgi:hypothetical protein